MVVYTPKKENSKTIIIPLPLSHSMAMRLLTLLSDGKNEVREGNEENSHTVCCGVRYNFTHKAYPSFHSAFAIIIMPYTQSRLRRKFIFLFLSLLDGFSYTKINFSAVTSFKNRSMWSLFCL
jgi:hypothetical protein